MPPPPSRRSITHYTTQNPFFPYNTTRVDARSQPKLELKLRSYIQVSVRTQYRSVLLCIGGSENHIIVIIKNNLTQLPYF